MTDWCQWPAEAGNVPTSAGTGLLRTHGSTRIARRASPQTASSRLLKAAQHATSQEHLCGKKKLAGVSRSAHAPPERRLLALGRPPGGRAVALVTDLVPVDSAVAPADLVGNQDRAAVSRVSRARELQD